MSDDDHTQELYQLYVHAMGAIGDLALAATHGGEDEPTYHTFTERDGGYVEVTATFDTLLVQSRSDTAGTVTVQLTGYPPFRDGRMH